MHIGLVGLGKMGGNMRTRMRNAGVTVVGFDFNPDLADVASLAEMVEQLPGPDGGARVVWVMVPAGEPTRDTIRELADLLGDGDLVSTAATRSTPTTRSTPRCWPSAASASSTAARPVASGDSRTATH